VAFSAVVLGTTVGSLWGVACGFFTGSPRPTQRRLAFGCGS